ncbi:lipopolysaccharide biosynthesis protein [Rhizobium mongolense]|uniref:lipopolysaccharide biosynthesis protein n=1 Tax=Rhizobium TaxID=379 RepID=UPI001EF8E92A|nr:polysaccharide biosynthesis C-terminal domain-containing protein [Rhizobium gallicum]ULJ71662.1 polysaccharide biosynthesis C-terminal domain-containing protein [Rhizobium gallicum]
MAKSIMANSALNAAAGLTLLATGFACSIIAARLLGPEANGIIAFSLWLVTTGALVAELGTGVMLLRILPQLRAKGRSYEERRSFAAYLVRPTIVASLIVLAVYSLVYFEAEQLHWAVGAPAVIVITGVLFLFQSIGAYTKNYLIGEQNLAPYFLLTIASSVVQVVIVLAGALLYGVSGALAGYAAGQFLMFLFTLRIASVRASSCGIGVGYLASSSFILSLEYANTSIFLNRIELFFLQKDWGVEAVGYYAVGLSLANLALQLPVQLSGSLIPYYSEKIHSNPNGKLPASIFEGVVRSIAYITLPMSFGLAAIAKPLVVAIFGQPFAPAGGTVAILALTAIPYVFTQICTQYLYSVDRIRERLMIGGIASLVLAVGCFAAVPWYGGEGAAAIRFLAFTVMCMLMVARIDLDGSIYQMSIPILRIAAAAALCGATAYGAIHFVPGIGGLVVAVITAAGAYGIALRLLNAVPAADIAVMEQIVNRLPKLAHPLAFHALALLTPRRI